MPSKDNISRDRVVALLWKTREVEPVDSVPPSAIFLLGLVSIILLDKRQFTDVELIEKLGACRYLIAQAMTENSVMQPTSSIDPKSKAGVAQFLGSDEFDAYWLTQFVLSSLLCNALLDQITGSGGDEPEAYRYSALAIKILPQLESE